MTFIHSGHASGLSSCVQLLARDQELDYEEESLKTAPRLSRYFKHFSSGTKMWDKDMKNTSLRLSGFVLLFDSEMQNMMVSKINC